MAKVKSTIFSVMKGKIGGLVFFNGPGGAILVRELVIPVNPNTPEQQEARTQMTNASKSWGIDLDDTERKSWVDYALVTPYENGLGQEMILSGMMMYVAVRTAVLGCDPAVPLSQFDLASCVGGQFLDPVISIKDCLTPEECGGIVQITNNDPTLTMSGMIMISGPQSAGVKFYRGPYDPTTMETFGPIAVSGTEDVSFCDLGCEGQKFFFKIRAYTAVTPYKISRMIYGSFTSVCISV